jgi:hypothetical protein
MTKKIKTILEAAIAAIPTTVTLTYIEHDDSLTDQQVASVLGGESDDVLDEISENLMDSQDNGVDSVLEEAVPDEDDREALKEDFDAFAQFQDVCDDRDDSTPFKELLQHTGRKMVRFHFRENGALVEMEESNDWDEERRTIEAQRLAKASGVDWATNAAAMGSLVEEASYGGKLCILAYVDIGTLGGAVEYLLQNEKGRVRLTFTDPFLLVHDGSNGSGYDRRVKGSVVFEFGKNDLSADRYGVLQLDAKGVGLGYSWSDDIAGVVYRASQADPKIELL